MQVKISELPASSGLSGNEQIPVVQSGETRKCTPDQIFDVQKSATWSGSSLVATNSAGTKLYTPYTLAELMRKAKIYTASGTLVSSAPTGSGVERLLDSVYFHEGFYGVVVVTATWGNNASGYRSLKCTDAVSLQVQVAPSPSGATRMQMVVPVLGTGTMLTFLAQQNSGSDINITASYMLVGFIDE